MLNVWLNLNVNQHDLAKIGVLHHESHRHKLKPRLSYCDIDADVQSSEFSLK